MQHEVAVERECVCVFVGGCDSWRRAANNENCEPEAEEAQGSRGRLRRFKRSRIMIGRRCGCA